MLDRKTEFRATGSAFWWAIVAFVIIGGLSTAALYFRPFWLGLERRAFTASHQYIENKRTSITTMIAQCAQLPEGAQKSALRGRIAAERALIPSDAQPAGGC